VSSRKFAVPSLVLLIAALLLSAQAQFRGGGRGRFRGGNDYRSPEEIKEQEEMEQALVPGFREDVFTFARLRFDVETGYGYGGPRTWEDDSPQADLTLTYRLFQTTCVKIRPGLNIIDITIKDLENHPFVYMASAGRLTLKPEDAAALRHYLLNGGFLMADDFWGDEQWHHFYEQVKQVFPDREPVELSLDDRIFHTVFDFKKLPQTPSVGSFLQYHIPYDPGWPYIEKSHDPHYYAIYDDKKRMMMLICHNNHFGDGWEHEGENESYFDTFSEPMGYPMFINLLYYTMTH
jgi:Domain of unknown function (DUF4159)